MTENIGSVDPLCTLKFSMGCSQSYLLTQITPGNFKLNVIETASRPSQTSLRREVFHRSNCDGQIRPCYLDRLSFGKHH